MLAVSLWLLAIDRKPDPVFWFMFCYLFIDMRISDKLSNDRRMRN